MKVHRTIHRPALLAIIAMMMTLASSVSAQSKPRARDLGIPFDGTPGPNNAITDVQGVEVGYTTLISGSGKLKVGEGPVRTGVTAVLPRGKRVFGDPVFAGWYSLNGNGEMTGTTWVEESGFLEGPVMITNTHSVGVVRDAVIDWRIHHGGPDSTGYWWSLPVVAETYDGALNDINGFHVKPEHVFNAIDTASGGAITEGNIGGGTGMICHEFKCGIGTSSRRVTVGSQAYTVGVLVQANYGVRDTLRIAGVPVGQQLREHRVWTDQALGGDTGSIIIVVATDAPLLPHQMKRIAKRAALGLARNGSYAGNGSGDLFVAFSTANADAVRDQALNAATFVGNDSIDPLFLGTVEATEEAIVNALIAARDMTGQGGHYAIAIPQDALRALLRKHSRLASR